MESHTSKSPSPCGSLKHILLECMCVRVCVHMHTSTCMEGKASRCVVARNNTGSQGPGPRLDQLSTPELRWPLPQSKSCLEVATQAQAGPSCPSQAPHSGKRRLRAAVTATELWTTRGGMLSPGEGLWWRLTCPPRPGRQLLQSPDLPLDTGRWTQVPPQESCLVCSLL